MPRPFVVVSGLPASGKTTLARPLAAALDLPLIDKDEILERDAMSSQGAVLASFWRLPGMPEESGTPTAWIATLSDQVVNVCCSCAPEVAARRFVQRERHPGHLDVGRPYDDTVARFRELSRLGPIDLGHEVLVDTSQETDLDAVVREVRSALARAAGVSA